MRFFHLSDLHIGKQLHNYNMKQDQAWILNRILDRIRDYRPDAVVIAGDIYDKTVPSAEAVSLFDEFLTGINELEPEIPVLLIAGNHDSGERLDFAGAILAKHQVFIAGVPPRTPEEYMKKVTLQDDYGRVNFYLLPFVKPSLVKGVFQETDDEQTLTYHDAVKKLLEREQINEKERNVLISHQFYVAGGKTPETSESETKSAGGIDEVDTGVLEPFDYAALGHIHKPQSMGKAAYRYCGTPLKYSVSEADQTKSITMVCLGAKGEEPQITEIPLEGIRDLRVLKGSLEEILLAETEENREDYVSITVTDEKEPYQLKEQLEDVYPHILELKVDNSRTRNILNAEVSGLEVTDPAAIFGRFFEELCGREMDDEERAVMDDVVLEAALGRNKE